MPPKKVKCPSCGSEVVLGKFCHACGAELIDESKAVLGEDVIEQIADRTTKKVLEELRKDAKPANPEPETKPAEKSDGTAGRFFK
jgi:hypothetical protein